MCTFCGCSRRSAVEPDPKDNTPNLQGPTEGETFLNTGFKIKSVITPQTTSTLDALTFEVYTDSKGNGTGLMGYKDDVYDVTISNNRVYVKVADNAAVQITDITGQFIPISLDLQWERDLSSKGFTMLEGRAVSYSSVEDTYIINTSYSLTDSTFDAVTVTPGNSMSIPDLIDYILASSNTQYVSTTTGPSDSVEPEKGSFWNNSWIGITIHGKTYSIGDYLNPSTYYENIIPEGVNPSYAYNGDVKVELSHVNYQSSDGRTSFMSTDGYVQVISTSCDFEFLGIKKGILDADLKPLLGVGLKKKELENWEPIVQGLEVSSKGHNSYILTYENYTIELKMDSKTRSLSEITLSNYIDFLK